LYVSKELHLLGKTVYELKDNVKATTSAIARRAL
jgi:hypothetical protein